MIPPKRKKQLVDVNSLIDDSPSNMVDVSSLIDTGDEKKNGGVNVLGKSVPGTSPSPSPEGSSIFDNPKADVTGLFTGQQENLQPSPKPAVYQKRAGAPSSYVNSIKQQEFFPFDPVQTLQKFEEKDISDRKSRVERGQGSVNDLSVLAGKDPLYTRNLISTLAPEINIGDALSPEGLSQAIGVINEKKRNALGAQKSQQQKELDQKIESLLLSQNVIDEPINIAQLSADGLGGDASYANNLLDKADLRKARELAELEVKYPKKRKLNEDIHLYVYSRDNPQAFNKEYHDIEEKYSNFAQLLGAKRANDLAKRDKSAAPSEIGMESFRIADRETYKTLKNTVGGSTGLERDIYQMGLDALYGAADNDGLYSLLAKDEKVADDLHPEKKSAEVYHKIGAVLHKDENWFANPKPSIAKLDAAAEQLDEEDKDFYYKHIRPVESKMSGVTNVPMRGFANKVASAIVSTAEETGKFIGDVSGVRSKSDVAFDALNEPFNTRNQNVGEHAPSVAELASLNEKQKKVGLTPDEIERKAELEKYTNIRSTFEDIIDGTGNLTGQVLFQAIATKGLGGLLTKGAKSVGILKGVQLADEGAYAGLEGFNGAIGAGSSIKIAASKELTTTIAADAIAYASSYDAAARQAAILFPDAKDSWKAKTYSYLNAYMNAASERIFKDEKVLDIFTKDFNVNVGSLLSKMTSGEVSRAAMQESLKTVIKNSVKKAYSVGKEALKEDLKETVEETGTQLFQSFTELALSPAKFNSKQAYDDAVSTATSTFLYGGLIGLSAGYSNHKSNYAAIPMLSKLGVDKSFTANVNQEVNRQFAAKEITANQRDEKINILNNAVKVNQEDAGYLATKGLSEKERGKYFAMRLNEQLLNQELERTTNDDKRNDIEKEIADSKLRRKSIIEGKAVVNEDYIVVPKEAATTQTETTPPASTTGAPEVVTQPIELSTNTPNAANETTQTEATVPVSTPEAGVTNETNAIVSKTAEEAAGAGVEEKPLTVQERLAKLKQKKSETLKEPKVSEAETLTQQVKPFVSEVKQPVYKTVFEEGSEEDVNNALKEVAQQANSSDAERKGAVTTFGENIVKLAQEKFPNEKVNINSEGALAQFEKQNAEAEQQPIVNSNSEVDNSINENNTKIGDIVYHNGQPVKIVEFRDSRKGGREAVIELPELTEEEIHNQAITILRNRYKEFSGSDAEVRKFHPGDYFNLISDLTHSDKNASKRTNVNFDELSKNNPKGISIVENKPTISKEQTEPANERTTTEVSPTIPTEIKEPKGQGNKEAVQPGTESTGQGNAETATTVLKDAVNEQENNLKINQDEAENKFSESKLTEQDNPVQEPSVKAIESKAKSPNKTTLNEVVRQVNKKIDEATGVQIMNPKDLSTDEARFQGREGLGNDKVNDIVANYKFADQDPIHVWKGKDGKTYVLSGHHRLAAALKAGEKRVKVQYRNDLNEEEAIRFAREEANLNRTNQTDLENAAILSRMRNEGRKEDIKKFLDRLGKNKTFIDDISRLNPKGKTLDALRAVQKSNDKVTQRETERIAQWIGAARKLDSRLTNAHENEMFDFLLSGTRYKNKQDFLKTISGKLGFDFDADKPLNLRRFKSDAENKFDDIKADLENKISGKQNQIDNIKDRFKDTKRKDYIATTAPDYQEVKKVADNKIADLNAELKIIQKSLENHLKEKGKFSSEGSLDLFSQPVPKATDVEKDISGGTINTDEGKMPIEQYVERAKAVLKKLFPEASLEAFNSTADYLDRADELVGNPGETYNTSGLALTVKGKKVILLDLESLKKANSSRTAFHEVIHPIVAEIIGNDFESLNEVWSELYEQVKDVKGFENVAVHLFKYRDVTKYPVEGITELLTQIADGNISLDSIPDAKKSKIYELLNKIFEKLGLSVRFGDDYSFKNFAADIKQAFETGDVEGLRLKKELDKAKQGNANREANAGKISNLLFGESDKGSVNLQKNINGIPNRLSPEEERGNRKAGEFAEKATNVLARVHRSSELSGEDVSELRQEEESQLKQEAVKDGKWVENPFKEFGNTPAKFGSEANVYLSKDGVNVIKLNSAVKYDTWQDYINSISIHNALFPREAYTLKGFTDLSGDFTAIVEQPAIRGKEATFDEVKEDMKQRGFEPFKSKDAETPYDFINNKTGVIISDLHGNNVIKDANGNLRYIDTVIRKVGNANFQQDETPNEDLKEWTDVVQGYIEENKGEGLSLKEVQDKVADFWGDRSQDSIVEEAYNAATKNLKVTGKENGSSFRKEGEKTEKIPNELSNQFTKRLNNFVDKLFGVSDSPEGHVVTLKGSDRLFEQAKKVNDANFQVEAFHGSPHSFDKFTTEKIGTGEGNQAFGWGLYFTGLKGVAENYARRLATVRLEQAYVNGDEMQSDVYDALESVDFLGFDDEWQALNEFVESKSKAALMRDYDLTVEEYDKIDKAIAGDNRNLYKVTLHEGKTPEQYDWLEWDKREKTKTLISKLKKAFVYAEDAGEVKKENFITEAELKVNTGASLYNTLAEILGSQKEASQILLKVGIDGIKYPAESIARGTTSDNARGSNYVVFDENAVTVKERVQFMYNRKGEILGFTDPNTGDVYLNGEKLNPNTPIHEAFHLWIDWAEKNRPDLLEEGLRKIRNEARYLSKVTGKDLYKTEADKVASKEGEKGSAEYKKAYDRYMEKEALAHAGGDNGAQFFMETRRNSFKAWANKLWEAVGKYFGIKNKTPEEIRKMTLGEFTKSIAADILDPNSTFEKQVESLKEEAEKEAKVTPVDLADVDSTDNTAGITHARMQDLADEFGFEDYIKSPETIAELDAEAAKILARDGEEAIKKIFRKITETEDGANRIENRMLLQYVASLRAKFDKNPMDKTILAALKQAREMIDVSNSRKGKDLQSLKGQRRVVDTLDNWMLDKMESLAVDELPDEVKKDIVKKFDKFQEESDNSQKVTDEYESEKDNLAAKLEIEDAKKQRSIIRRKSKDALNKERKSIVDHMKAKLAEARNKQNVTIIPYANELVAIAPDISKLVRNTVDLGIINFEGIVDNVHELLKDEIKDITKGDVIALIGGRYSRQAKTKGEIETRLAEIKKEAKLLDELGRLENDETLEKSKSKSEDSERIKELKESKTAATLRKEIERLESGGELKSPEKKEEDSQRVKELRRRLNELNTEAELVAELERLKNGGQPKDINRSIKRNQRIKQLKEAIKDFDAGASVSSTKARYDAEIEQLEEDLKNKNYVAKKKLPRDMDSLMQKTNPELWKRTMDARIKRDELKQQWEFEKQQDELARRNWLQKSAGFLAKLVGTSQAIKAGIDDSVTFIQLGAVMVANPRLGIKSKIEAIRDISNQRYKRQLAQLHASPYWDLMEKSGLSITEPHSMHKERMEEMFRQNLLDKDFKIAGKGYNLWTNTGGIFERLFTSMSNNMRVGLFMGRVELLLDQKKTFATHPQEFKDAANAVNNLTARAKINKNADSDLVRVAIWAPQMLASSLNLLGISDIAFAAVGKKGYYGKLDPAQRKFALSQMGRAIGLGVLVMAAAAARGWEPDKDPTSSTFGTILIGQTRYSIFGRFTTIVKAIMQIALSKRTTDKGVQDLDSGKFGSTTGGTILGRFFRGKMTPAAGLVYDYKFNAKKNFFTYEPISLDKVPDILVTPMAVENITNGLKQDGAWSLLTRALPSIEGINIYDKRDWKKFDKPQSINTNRSRSRTERAGRKTERTPR